MLVRLFLLLAIGPAVARAQSVAAPCRGSVDGHAVDASSHEPVVAATVRVGDELLATTDDAGRFTLTGLCASEVTVIVERADYTPARQVVGLGDQASLEVRMTLLGEVIEVHERAPPPPEMRSTAVITGAALERTRGRSFTDAIASVPGVTELRAATGVGKPIIRGQFGRRLLILVDDVRHRAQEWGLEHAPEIDPSIADRIRVVRGPGGVRYGADAIGGVVLIDPPELRREPGYNGEVHLIGTSNGRGGTVVGRLQGVLAALPSVSGQLEGSVKRLAAPETPRYALDNAGLFEWSGGATIGVRRRGSEYKLSYRHYDANLGVCSCLRVHNVDDFLAQAKAGAPTGADEFRSDFGIDRPYQAVAHDLALVRGSWERAGLGTLTATYSFQSDRRREYDVVRNADEAGAQFDFRLFTHDVGAVLEHHPLHLSEHWHLRGAAGVTGVGQVHEYGGLHLVPDYTSLAAGAFATERLVGHTVDLEVGGRYDLLARTASLERLDFQRLVRSGQLGPAACGGDDGAGPIDCASRYHTFTASAGAMWRFAEPWSIKGDVSAASRAPNPDEQYLNGTAPTFPVLGLGKPDIGPETTYSTSLTLAVAGAHVAGEVSVFANVIDDYIYFAPAIGDDGMPIFDTLIRGTFPRFVTRPIDALFYGADGGVTVTPIAQLELAGQASLVRAKNRADGSYLVFVPADHYRGSITYHPAKNLYATITGSYVARQRRFDIAADFIAPPPAYFLLGAELGAETSMANQKVRIAMQGMNLTNARYRDYTSLMRYFADEPGWQVWLRMSLVFDSTKKGP